MIITAAAAPLVVLVVLFVPSLAVFASLIYRVIKWRIVIQEVGRTSLICFSPREVMALKSPIIRCLPRHHFLWGLPQPGLQTRWFKMLTLGLLNRVHFHQLLNHHHHHSAKMGDVLGASLGKSQLQLGSKVLTVAETAAFLQWHRNIYLCRYPQRQGEKPLRGALRRERGTMFRLWIYRV